MTWYSAGYSAPSAWDSSSIQLTTPSAFSSRLLFGLMPLPTFSLLILDLLFFSLLRHETIDEDGVQIMSEDVALNLTAGCDLVCTHKTAVLVVSGPANHLEQAQFQQQPGLAPEAFSEAPNGRLVHSHSPADARGGPVLFKSPEDVPLLFRIEPGMLVLGASSRRAIRESLVQSQLWHVYTNFLIKG